MENKTVVVVKGIVMYEGKLLLVKRSEKNKVGAGSWEFAGGKLSFGEELDEALVREVEEETGIKIKPKELLFATVKNDDPIRQLVFLHYLCDAENNDVKLSDEHTDFAWVTKTQLKEFLSIDMLCDLERNHLFELEVFQ